MVNKRIKVAFVPDWLHAVFTGANDCELRRLLSLRALESSAILSLNDIHFYYYLNARLEQIMGLCFNDMTYITDCPENQSWYIDNQAKHNELSAILKRNPYLKKIKTQSDPDNPALGFIPQLIEDTLLLFESPTVTPNPNWAEQIVDLLSVEYPYEMVSRMNIFRKYVR